MMKWTDKNSGTQILTTNDHKSIISLFDSEVRTMSDQDL